LPKFTSTLSTNPPRDHSRRRGCVHRIWHPNELNASQALARFSHSDINRDGYAHIFSRRLAPRAGQQTVGGR